MWVWERFNHTNTVRVNTNPVIANAHPVIANAVKQSPWGYAQPKNPRHRARAHKTPSRPHAPFPVMPGEGRVSTTY